MLSIRIQILVVQTIIKIVELLYQIIYFTLVKRIFLTCIVHLIDQIWQQELETPALHTNRFSTKLVIIIILYIAKKRMHYQNIEYSLFVYAHKFKSLYNAE